MHTPTDSMCALSNPHLSFAAGFGTLFRRNPSAKLSYASPASSSRNFAKRHLKYTKYIGISFARCRKNLLAESHNRFAEKFLRQVAGFHRAVPSTTLDKACMQFGYIIHGKIKKSRVFRRFLTKKFINPLWTNERKTVMIRKTDT